MEEKRKRGLWRPDPPASNLNFTSDKVLARDPGPWHGTRFNPARERGVRVPRRTIPARAGPRPVFGVRPVGKSNKRGANGRRGFAFGTCAGRCFVVGGGTGAPPVTGHRDSP